METSNIINLVSSSNSHSNNNYVIVVEPETGERIASYLLKSDCSDLEAKMNKAKEDYKDKQYMKATEEEFRSFLNGKVYLDGEFKDKPEYIPTPEEVERKRRKDIEAEYLPRLEAIRNGMMAKLAQGDEITQLQDEYKALLNEMTEKLNNKG